MQTCRECGCDDAHACLHDDFGPCWWWEPDLCSHCAMGLDCDRAGRSEAQLIRAMSGELSLDHAGIARQLALTPPVEFAMDASNAFVLVALLQLALRHPALTDQLAEIGLEVVDGIRAKLPQALHELIDLGFHPDNDTLVTGDPA